MNESRSKESTVPEKATQGSSTPAAAWSWVDRSVWSERMLAALGNGVQGNKWFSLIDKVYRPRTLQGAWQRVRRKRGAAGIDGQTIERFAAREAEYLGELSHALKTGSYRAQGVRRVEIPKGPGKTRPLGIPTVKDRIVQMAVKQVIEPIFEREFVSTSYGFRPGRSCKDALREVDGLLKAGYTHAVDADLKSYFDTIPQDRLMACIQRRISDGRIVALLGQWLQQEVVKGMARWTPTGGTPQGAVISPLLANIYLHDLDVAMLQRGYRMVRYADDFVILCRSAEEARRALDEVRQWVEAHGLTLHPDKTRVGDCTQAGQGFDFLGYRFEAGRRSVRRKSWRAMRAKLRAKTRRNRGDSLAHIIADINPILRGWYGYFKHAHAWTFPILDGFVRRRLRAILRKQQKRPGFGRCYNDHRRWPNCYFAAAGLFTMTEARQQASQPR